MRLPKEFEFHTREVVIRKEGADVILSPRPGTWAEYLATQIKVPDDFMEGVDDPPPEDRDFF